jgi:hypothetical protein
MEGLEEVMNPVHKTEPAPLFLHSTSEAGME